MENPRVEEEGEEYLNMKIKYVMLIIGLILIIGGGFVFINRGISDADDFVSSVSPLNTRSDMEWDTIVNSITKDDATTNCYNHLIEGTHHTLYCDKIAGSDTELGFKTFFKSKVKDYTITETKTIPRQEKVNIFVGVPYDCIENKNGTCYRQELQESIRYWDEKISTHLLTDIKNNDWEVSDKRLFTKGEKRTYKIEWEDFAPTIQKPQITNLGNGIQRATFPLVDIYENELSINPNRTWNYTTNNWGGVASGTELDSDNNITAIYSAVGGYPDYLEDLTETAYMCRLNDSATTTNVINIGSGNDITKKGNTEPNTNDGITEGRDAFYFDRTDDYVYLGTSTYFNATMLSSGAIQFWIYPEKGLAIYNSADNYVFASGGGRGEVHGNSTSAGDVTKGAFHYYDTQHNYITIDWIWNEWQMMTIKWNATGHYVFRNATLLDSDTRTNGIAFQNSKYTWISAYGAGSSTPEAGTYFGMRMQDLYVGGEDITQQQMEDSYYIPPEVSYNALGNITLDGFFPNYPDNYEAVGSGFSQVDNDINNYGGLTIETASDNSTWANEVSFDAIAGTQSSCFQLIPNITTDTTTTPRIYEVWLDYKSLISPSINITSPENTTYYSSSVNLDVSAYDVDGIDTLWYTYNYTDNTTIDYPNNVTLDDLSDGSYKLSVWVNDTDNNMNTTNVTFTIYPVPTTITPIINSSNVIYNRTDNDIYCIFQPLSNLGGADLTANITWWFDGVINATNNEVEVTNGTQYVETLLPAGTRRDDNITCEVVISDGDYSSEPRNSSEIIIVNSPPTIPIYDYPANDTRTENVTNELRCYGSTDADNDPINYVIMGDISNPPTTLLQNTTATGYNWTLTSIGDYWWRCRAEDSTDISDYLATRYLYMNNVDIIKQ